MVTRVQRDDRRVVPRVDQREVVRAHLVDALGVLIDQRRVRDRVSAGVVVDHTKHRAVDVRAIGRAHRKVLVGRVVRPHRRHRLVAARPEQRLDRVREADVDRARRVGVEVLHRGSLHLLDEDITRGARHLLTLIVRHNRVVRPHVDVRHDLVSIRVQQVARRHRRRRPGAGSATREGVDRHQLRQVTEGKVNAHLVVRQRSRRQSNARVTRVEERKRKVKGGCRQHLLTRSVHSRRLSRRRRVVGEGNRSRVGEGINVADHVVVTVALASRHRKGSPEVKVVVVEASRDEVVKGNGALRDQVVHQVIGPAKNLGARRRRRGVGNGRGNRVHCETQPGVQQVVTRARNRDRPLLTKAGLTRAAAQADGNLGKPGGLANLANEIGNRIRTTVQILLLFIIRGEIDKTRSQVG